MTSEYYDWKPDRICAMFPYTTDQSAFCPTPTKRSAKRQEVRARHGIGPGTHVFLSVAKFVDRENPWFLIKSYERLRAPAKDIHLVAIGDGPLLKDVAAYSADRGLKASFPGFVPFADLPQYFFGADTFVHFAKNEPWGTSPQDAILAGLNLIASKNVGSGAVFLTGALSRFRVDVTDPDSGAEAMSAVLSEGRIVAFAAARQQVEEEYTVAATARRWSDVCRRLTAASLEA